MYEWGKVKKLLLWVILEQGALHYVQITKLQCIFVAMAKTFTINLMKSLKYVAKSAMKYKEAKKDEKSNNTGFFVKITSVMNYRPAVCVNRP